MAEKCTLEELVRRQIQKEFVSLIDPNDIENINKVADSAASAFSELTSGAKDLLDILDSGISSRSLRILSSYLSRSQEGRDILGAAGDIAQAIDSSRKVVESLQRLLSDTLGAVDEIAALAVPSLDDDLFELGLSSIPGIVESELIEILGGCK